MISCLTLTIDRFDITSQTWLHNIQMAGVPREELEFLVCDNGSKDTRVIEFFKNANLKYHRVNSKNEGVGKALNQLFLRSTGDYICLLSNDIKMERDWLFKMRSMVDRIPDSGIVGVDWGHGSTPPITNKFGIDASWLDSKLNRIFGTWLMRRHLIDTIGFFCEDFGPYGLEDSDFNERVNRFGYFSCYMPNMKCEHLVNDVGDNSDYRKMKDESMGKNLEIFSKRVQAFDVGDLETLVCTLPEMRGPI